MYCRYKNLALVFGLKSSSVDYKGSWFNLVDTLAAALQTYKI